MSKIFLSDYSIHYSSIRVENSFDDKLILLFLHEALGSIPQWKSFPETLCKALNLNGIIYERRGHGESSELKNKRTARYLHEYAYNELPEFLEQVTSHDQKVILVGHSDGGTIALLYSAKYPKKVHSCITMAAHVINEPETIKGIDPAIQAFEAGKLDGLKKYHGSKTDALFYAWADTWKDDSFKNWNICDDIHSIICPLLAIQGKNDQYGTIKQLDLIKENTKNTITELIENCGHHPHLENPLEVLEVIKNWIRF